MKSAHRTTICIAFALLLACSDGVSQSQTRDNSEATTVPAASQTVVESPATKSPSLTTDSSATTTTETCKRRTKGPLTPGYQAQIDISCEMPLGSGPTVRFERMESDQNICRPFMVGIAPRAMEFRFLIEYQLGELGLRKSAFRISGTMLEDRMSGAVYLGAWEDFVETPCEELDMTITEVSCGGRACSNLTFKGTDIFAGFTQR